MTLKGKGKFLIVDIEEDNRTQGSITIVQNEQPAFARGVVITGGPYVIIADGAEVIISLEQAKVLGLGYPNTYRVIDDASLIAVLESDEEDPDETG